uniref:Uncharacterized protein n=1 Tax=Eptatretus burgeri TaxID=7764 RepID=A0A8C4QEH1_EPTBU
MKDDDDASPPAEVEVQVHRLGSRMTYREGLWPKRFRAVTTMKLRSGESAIIGFASETERCKQADCWTIKRGVPRKQSVQLPKNYLVQAAIFLKSHHLFVVACADLHLYFHNNLTRGFQLINTMAFQDAVLLMEYLEETDELVTAGIGLPSLWIFTGDFQQPLLPSRLLRPPQGDWWPSCLVLGLLAEATWKALLCLWEDDLVVFDCKGEADAQRWSGNIGGNKLSNPTIPNKPWLTCLTVYSKKDYVFTGDVSGFIKVWNRHLGEVVHSFLAHVGGVVALALQSGTCSRLLSAGRMSSVCIWHLPSCTLLTLVHLEEAAISAGFLTVDGIGTTQFYCITHSTLSLWISEEILEPLSNLYCTARILHLTPGFHKTQQLLVLGNDKILRLLVPDSGVILSCSQPLAILEEATELAFSETSDQAFALIPSKSIVCLDCSKHPCTFLSSINTPQENDSFCCLVELHLELDLSSCDIIVAGTRQGDLCMLNTTNAQVLCPKVHIGGVCLLSCFLDYSPSERMYPVLEQPLLASYGLDGILVLWTAEQSTDDALSLKPATSAIIGNSVQQMSLGADQAWFMRDNGSVSCFDIKTETLTNFTELAHEATITAFEFNSQQDLLLTASVDGLLRLRSSSFALLTDLNVVAPVSTACFALDGTVIIIALGDNVSLVRCAEILPAAYIYRQSKPDPQGSVGVSRQLVTKTDLYSSSMAVPNQHSTSASPSSKSSPMTTGKSDTIIQNADSFALKGSRYILQKSSTPTSPEELSIARQKQMMQKIPGEEDSRFNTRQKCRIPFDGYIPNSVIRAMLYKMWKHWENKRKATGWVIENLSFLDKLLFDDVDEEWTSDTHKIKKIQKRQKHTSGLSVKQEVKIGEEEDEGSFEFEQIPSFSSISDDSTQTLLEQVANSWWFEKTLDRLSLQTVIRRLLELMINADKEVYLQAVQALNAIFKEYLVPTYLKMEVELILIDELEKEEYWRRSESAKLIQHMDTLSDKLLRLLVHLLIDNEVDVRVAALNALTHHTGVTNKLELFDLLTRRGLMAIYNWMDMEILHEVDCRINKQLLQEGKERLEMGRLWLQSDGALLSVPGSTACDIPQAVTPIESIVPPVQRKGTWLSSDSPSNQSQGITSLIKGSSQHIHNISPKDSPQSHSSLSAEKFSLQFETPLGTSTSKAHWRRCLHTLIDLYGPRKSGTALFLDIYRQAHTRSLKTSSVTVPQSKPSPGQRVAWRSALMPSHRVEAWGHIIKMPWRLSFETVERRGCSHYGPIRVDWIAGSPVPHEQIPG